jgi:hypothetical protein
VGNGETRRAHHLRTQMRTACCAHSITSPAIASKPGGNCGPERISGFAVDDELELGRLLDRKIGRLGALKDLIHECRRAPEEVDEVQVTSALGRNERRVALAISLGNATQCF